MTGKADAKKRRYQWRDYQTDRGNRPVKEFLKALTPAERAAIYAGMKDVQERGVAAAKHLAGDIYEVKVDTNDKFFRILFAPEGRFGQVFLALEGFAKKTNKTPPAKLKVARDRLRDWRTRGC